MEQRKMVKVPVEVRSGASRFKVGIRTGNITKALSLVRGRYPNGEVRVAFTAGLAGFYVREPSAPGADGRRRSDQPEGRLRVSRERRGYKE